MLPKNNIRLDILDNLIIHKGMYHNHIAQKLPQFTQKKPQDINTHIGLDNINKDNTVVVFESDPSSTPKEMKDIPRVIDQGIAVPYPLQDVTHQNTKENIFRNVGFRRGYKHMKRYREY